MTTGSSIAPPRRLERRVATRTSPQRERGARARLAPGAEAGDLSHLQRRLAARLPRFSTPAAGVEGLEERCRMYLRGLRWPAGIECPRCDERARVTWLEPRAKWQCYACRYQFSV